MQFLFRNCTHILTRTQGEKFEDMFLVTTASKGTSLSFISFMRFLVFLFLYQNNNRKLIGVLFSFINSSL